MQPEAIAAEPGKQTDKPRNTRRAVALLLHAAAPERRQAVDGIPLFG